MMYNSLQSTYWSTLLFCSLLNVRAAWADSKIVRADVPCTSDLDCSVLSNNSKCIKSEHDAETGVCYCDYGYYSVGSDCKLIHGLEDDCSPCTALPWDCSNFICACASGYFFDQELNTCQQVPEQIFDRCKDTDDCAKISNSICEPYYGQISYCICERNYILSSKTLNCIPIPEHLYALCEFENDCVNILNSTCVEGDSEDAWGTCECIVGYEPDEDLQGCSEYVTSSTTEDPTTTTQITSESSSTTMETTVSTTMTTNTTTSEPSTTTRTSTEQTTLQASSTTHETSPTTSTEATQNTTPSTTTTSTTTTTTTTHSPPPPGTAECEAFDQFGSFWKTYAGFTATKLCPGRESGFVSWVCDLSGHFVGDQPNYSDCTTQWVTQMSQEIEDRINNGTLDLEVSTALFDNMNTMMEDALQFSSLNPTQNGETQFFGHEINNILNLTERVVINVNYEQNADVSQFEDVTQKSLGMVESLMKFQKPWGQLNQVEKISTFDNTIKFMEVNGLNLAERVEGSPEDESQYNYAKTYGEHNNAYMLTAGSTNIDDSDNTQLSFPMNSKQVEGKDSFIVLPTNWWNVVRSRNLINRKNNDSSSVYFVGMELDANFVKENIPGKIYNGQNHNLDLTRNLNSKQMSFTIGEEGESIDFGDEFVQVTFQLEENSWSCEPKKLRRRLHPGENPRAVGCNPTCSYFDKELKTWSTKGCKLVSDGPYSVTCACNHLSAFALLSQFHQYGGKSLPLQIITMAGPGLPALLQLRELYSSPPHPLRWRQDFRKFLMIFFIIGHFTLVVLVDRHYFLFSEGLCYFIGIATHFYFLACFLFLLILTMDVFFAIDLSKKAKHVILVKLITKLKQWKKYIYLVIGLIIPIFIVGLTAIIEVAVGPNSRAYGGEFCWLDGSYIWAFYAPALIIFIINCGLILYYKFISTKEDEASEWEVLSTNIQFSILLFFSWLVAYYQIGPSFSESSFLAFAFPLINGLQGFMLAKIISGPSESGANTESNVGAGGRGGGGILRSTLSNLIPSELSGVLPDQKETHPSVRENLRYRNSSNDGNVEEPSNSVLDGINNRLTSLIDDSVSRDRKSLTDGRRVALTLSNDPENKDSKEVSIMADTKIFRSQPQPPLKGQSDTNLRVQDTDESFI